MSTQATGKVSVRTERQRTYSCVYITEKRIIRARAALRLQHQPGRRASGDYLVMKVRMV